ncbi:MAG TPA: hypothetical protein P5230_00130 [Candidatus Magasanikbacteria bacterium]|nr:hypothetical protein [Candidatus Magasanikbacteria bacterium]
MKASEYQNQIAELLKQIFPAELVKKEWDSSVTFNDLSHNKMVYAPRIDVAIGPFNNRFNLDVGEMPSDLMKKHPFTRMMFERHYNDIDDFDKVWNSFSRCYLAIEVEFSGSAKHIFGSIINAVTNGSLAFIITNKENYSKVDRIIKYIWRQENQEVIELNTLKNLLVFEEGEFLEVLREYLKKV